MTKSKILAFICCLLTYISFSQSDTSSQPVTSGIFARISKSVKDFKLDTTASPDDKFARKVMELRSLRGGYNIDEAIDFKIEQDKQKNEAPKEEIEQIAVFFKSGKGKKLLDNAIVSIYRQSFSYKELKQLVRFYKTSAGQKWTTDFPIIMMQSLTAAEMIKDIYVQQQKSQVR